VDDRTVEKDFPTDLVERAIRLALVAYNGRTRKVDGLPCIVHPFMVALKLSKHGFPDPVIAAALTHDVLEYTTCTPEQLKAELGNDVYEIVIAVTHDDRLSWEEKKKKYVETVRNGPEGAKAIAIADKIHNIEKLLAAYTEHGPDIWKKIDLEKEQKSWFEKEVLWMLREAWDHPLIDECENIAEILLEIM